MANNNMRFVGLIDLLGFKNLVKSPDPSKGLAWLLSEVEKIRICVERTVELEGWKLAEFAWFSDTIVFYTEDDSDISLLGLVACVSRFLFESLGEGFPARGAITHGELHVGKGQGDIVGRALVDAYELEKKQDWCGAIIAPGILHQEQYKKVRGSTVQLIVEYNAPLKHGEAVKTYDCIMWPTLFSDGFKGPEPPIRKLFLRHHNKPTTWDVEQKIQNTENFLNFCRSI
ncbi:MAG: hypothetical protein COV45_00055 [Deltaproteobacteria bacterium CG11_big_fil_rev_8_21_14_0_20_47_16]|nr:MAG: hypothetical protein COV45_00055 [Deltaproteobacteria bacterium CG11_big_fil_rev_8_21_14_0_20_47_16]